MTVWELFIAAVCLSMDAFAVSVCKGLSIGKAKAKHCLTAGLYFGIFQALMPLAGYLQALSPQGSADVRIILLLFSLHSSVQT